MWWDLKRYRSWVCPEMEIFCLCCFVIHGISVSSSVLREIFNRSPSDCLVYFIDIDAQFALLSIGRKIHYVFCLCVGTISMPLVLTYGFSSNPHAQFVEFPCVRLLRRSALCNPCLVQLSDLNMWRTLWMLIRTNAHHQGRGFLQDYTMARERTTLKRVHQIHKPLGHECKWRNWQELKGIYNVVIII